MIASFLWFLSAYMLTTISLLQWALGTLHGWRSWGAFGAVAALMVILFGAIALAWFPPEWPGLAPLGV